MKHKKNDEFLTRESDVYNFWKRKFRTLKKFEQNREISSIPCKSDRYKSVVTDDYIDMMFL